MPVGALVDQHAVDGGAQVGAVVEVEAAQVELVGLALATVLADDQARRGFEQLAGSVDGARVELFLGDRADAGRIGHTNQARRGAAGDDDGVQRLLTACPRDRCECGQAGE